VICSACGHEVPDRAKFCDACGIALALRCTSCAAELRPAAKFCSECGAVVSASGGGVQPAASATHAPHGHTPKHLADKILRSKSALEGERKQVTVLFADVKGSMDLAEQLDPEEWSAIMRRFFEILSGGVERFEGFVDKFTGDGIMALFGAPIAHEDHAQRACYAALYLRDALKRYADELRRTNGLSVSVRIGIHSGEVVVGTIATTDSSGDGLRMDYTAQGHTVGLAQRMEQRAAADSAYLTEHTADLVAGYFDLRDLGAFELKGVSAPVRVYELAGIGALRSRLDRSRARGFSRFVGRTEELAVLDGALSRALEGHGGAVGVVADAGIGKSRLCMEFIERCRARGVAVYQGHCPSHGKVLPLLPIFELFRDYFGITQRDDDQVAREKIAGRMLLLDRELEPFLPLAFDFLGVPDPAQPVTAMEPAVRQRQLLAFTRRLIQARSVREPAVLFVDDAHWLDDSSDAFIAQVADIVPGTRTMLLLNFRPEYNAEWMARSSYQQLPLHPLAGAAIDELLTSLLGRDPALVGLAALIRDRTNGNPFFMEEIVQSLVESGTLIGEPGAYRSDGPVERLDVPPTVHGILAARIDRLPEREKSLLQTAAVIGRKFGEGLLRRVSELSSDQFEHSIAALRHAEFIQEEAIYPEIEYEFRHPLTHEVAERSQLASHRRRVHVAVARALEELHADKPDEHAALLAHHWDLGGQPEPAVRWHVRAAQWIAGNDSPEARRHWSRIRELAEQIQDPTASMVLGRQSRLMLLEYGWRLGMSADEANELLREGEAWARSHDDPHALAALYNAFSIPCAFNLGDPRRAVVLLDEGFRLAEQVGDTVLACVLELRRFFTFQRQGLASEAAAAMAAVERYAPEILEQASALVGYDVPSSVLGFGGWMDEVAGNLEDARDRYRRGITLARAKDAVEVVGWLLTSESDACWALGDSARATGAARESLEIAGRVGSPLSEILALRSLGRASALVGDTRGAMALMERGLSLAERTDLSREPEMLCELALVHCAAGALDHAQRLAERSVELAAAREIHGVEVYGLRALASVHVARGGSQAISDAARLLDQAESMAERIGYRSILPHLYELRAGAAERAGDDAACAAALDKARELFREMGATARAKRLAKPSGS